VYQVVGRGVRVCEMCERGISGCGDCFEKICGTWFESV
jgi:hypothetical protein